MKIAMFVHNCGQNVGKNSPLYACVSLRVLCPPMAPTPPEPHDMADGMPIDGPQHERNDPVVSPNPPIRQGRPQHERNDLKQCQ